MATPLKLLHVSIQNYQAVVEVEFDPARSGATIIGGKNDNGKTSTIGAITSALRGAALVAKEPVRYGEDKSKTTLEIGDDAGNVALRVVQELKLKDGEITRKLSVTDGDNKPRRSPQEVLNDLYSRVAFDPSAFATAEPAEQDAILKGLAGITDSFAELERDYAVIYEARTDKNREAKKARTLADSKPRHSGVPSQEVSVAALGTELDAIREHNRARSTAEERLATQEGDVGRAQAEVAKLQAQLRVAEDALAAQTKALAERREALAALGEAKPTEELEAKLATIDETNRKVRENLAKKAEEKRADELEAEAETMTKSLDTIDAKKEELLLNAKFPVPGLGFGPLGPTLNGAPLAQCSMARRLELSYRVGVAQNPELRLMILKDGAFFDEESMADLDQMAQKDGFQLLVERVGKREQGASVVIIEKGLVESTSSAAE